MYCQQTDTFSRFATKLGDSVIINGDGFELVKERIYNAHLKGEFTDEELDNGEDIITITAYVFYCLLDDEDEDGNFVDTPIWFVKVYADDYDYYHPLIAQDYVPAKHMEDIDDIIQYNVERLCKDLTDVSFVCES